MKKIDKKKMYMILGITILCISIIGSAYAYYSASASSTISGTAGGGNLTLNVEKLSTSANDTLVPLDNNIEMLTKAALGNGNDTNTYDNTKSCIDKNGNSACQIYKVTITNTSSVPITLNGGVTLQGENTPNIECALMDTSISVTDNTSCIGKKTLANKYTLNANTSKDYYIMIYIKNIEGVQTDSGDFNGIITFTSIDGAELKATFSDNKALQTLTKLGLSVDTEHTPDFNTVSGNSGKSSDGTTGLGDGTNGIYEAEDDLGTSYYFRGDVQNNYVSFANYTWRIIRINGDGSIRMMLEDKLKTSKYNTPSSTNERVGYMYGIENSSTYEETHKNTNDSTIKGVVDTWYQENLSSYSDYIEDAIYCNDRQVVTDIEFTVKDASSIVTTFTFNGDGTGENQTAYASVKRNHLGSINPTLKCTQKNDRFTTNDKIGNGALTYPVGLITSDEAIMAGAGAGDLTNNRYIANTQSYLPTDCIFWTMTPFIFNEHDQKYGEGGAVVSAIGDGLVGELQAYAYFSYVFPVISLKSDAISGGQGTEDTPFYVG